MWMARDQKEERLQEPGAELGQVTLAGAPVGVALAGERRNVTLCLPGGYHWTPRQGEVVLVIKSGPEGAPCVVGAPEADPAAPGEVWLSVAQGVGVIDPDYTGEILVMLLNTSGEERILKRGERMAQLVFQPFVRPVWQEVEILSATERGAGGFGHTGR